MRAPWLKQYSVPCEKPLTSRMYSVASVVIFALPVLGIALRNGAYYPMIVRTISLKLPDDLLVQLDNEAKARRVTKSRLIRESLEKTFRKPLARGPVSCYDLARDLAGSIKGLPEDLATNPDYLEGFRE